MIILPWYGPKETSIKHPHWLGLDERSTGGPERIMNSDFNRQCSRNKSAGQDQGIYSCRCVASTQYPIAGAKLNSQLGVVQVLSNF